MSTRRLKIFNGRIISPHRIIPNGTVVVTGETITAVVEHDVEVKGAIEIDAQGNYISPGFIDIHVHGGGGHDFMDCNETAFLKIAETHARHGTTAMVPTTLSCERDELVTTLELYKQADKKKCFRCAVSRHAHRRSILCHESTRCTGSALYTESRS